MALDLLGENFDLHGGGQDLAFPHHENERAQAVADGRGFSRRWVHSGIVLAEGGEKMSKSLGNTLSLTELLDAYDPRALRLLVLQSHYRRPMIVSDDNLRAAEAGIARLDTFARQFAAVRDAMPDPSALDRFRDRMDDDLDTPNAVGEAFKWVTDARAQGSDALATAVFEVFEKALGIPLNAEGEEAPEEAQALARERDVARTAKDWARADEIRAQLQSQGWIVEDGPEGTTIRR
jgi:cysteinyl-tRNA synthetase